MHGKREIENCSSKILQVLKFSPRTAGDTAASHSWEKDVFARMATGAGKSLCMFLAPLAISESAACIVISPLSALMDQQVWQRNFLCG